MVKTRNRLLGVLLSLTVAFGLLAGVSMNAAAEETPHVHAVSTDCSTSDGEQVTFEKLTSAGGALTSGNYYLDDDIELENNLIIYNGVTVNLCLNGHVLTGDGSGDAVITSEGVLNLCDCNGSDGTHKFAVDSETGLWKADDSGEKTVTGGVITGGSNDIRWTNGGGGVSSEKTFNMYGGSIVGNSSELIGGGVYNGDTFNMYGGSIVGNRASDAGGGVYNSGSFNMYGGSIADNIADFDGGGVYQYIGTFSMSGGSITGNSANDGNGGGVYLDSDLPIQISGNPVIMGNKNGDDDQNTYLADAIVVVTDELTEGANIGISVYDGVSETTELVKGDGTYTPSVYDLAKFHSDNPNLVLVKSGTALVAVKRHIEISGTSLDGTTAKYWKNGGADADENDYNAKYENGKLTLKGAETDVIIAYGDLTVEPDGENTVTTTSNYGINVIGGSLTVTPASGADTAKLTVDGIFSDNAVTIGGGANVRTTGNTNGIYAFGDVTITDEDTDVYSEGVNYYDGIYSYSGSVTVKDGAALEAKGNHYGIYLHSDVTVSGGSRLKAIGNTNGIYAEGDVTITDKDTDVYVEGGTLDGDYYDGIYCDSDIIIKDGAAVEAKGDRCGIYVPGGDMTVSGGSKVKTTGNTNGICTDGDIIITDKDTDVYAEGGTSGGNYYNAIHSYSGSITIKDGAAVEAKGDWAGITVSGDVTVSGGSKLKATGVHEEGICTCGDIIITDKDTDVYAEGGTYNGYYYNGVCSYYGSITIKDGAAVEAKGDWNGIYVPYGDVTVSGGSKVKTTGVHADGIYADGSVTITGKNTDVYAKGGTYGYYEDQEYVEWTYDGIWSTTGITISDGAAVEAVGDWSGLETNGDVTVSGDGTKVTASGQWGISAYNADDTDNENRNVTVTGGKLEATGTESAIRGVLVTELEVKEGETKETAEVSDVDYSGSGTTTESKYVAIGTDEPACHAVKTVSPKDGTLQMYSGETYMGEYTFARKGSGWTICGEDGLYLTVSSGKLAYSETPMAWTYRSGAFSYTESTRGSYRNSSCKTYYLTASGVSTRSARITLKEEVSYDAHNLAVKANRDGTHTFTCKNCGYSYSEDCDFSDWTKDAGKNTHTHSCSVCSYKETKACEGETECEVCGGEIIPESCKVSVNVTKRTSSSWFRRQTTYSVTIKVDATAMKVKTVEYSKDGKRWTRGTSFTSQTAVDKLYIRVNGEKIFYYDGTTVTQQ